MIKTVFPNTKHKAYLLKKLLEKPFPSKNAEFKLLNILADEFIFDDIKELRKANGFNYDIRDYLKNYVRAIVYDLEYNPEDFLIKFNDDAITILKSILNE